MSDEQVDAAVSAYDRADPNAVVDALAEPAERLAQVAEDAGFDVWSREIIVGATRSDGRRLLEHALHDSLHHLSAADHGLAALRSNGSSTRSESSIGLTRR